MPPPSHPCAPLFYFRGSASHFLFHMLPPLGHQQFGPLILPHLLPAVRVLVPSAGCLGNSYAICKALSSLSLYLCTQPNPVGWAPVAPVPQAPFPDHGCSRHLAGSLLPQELSTHGQALTPQCAALRLALSRPSAVLPAWADHKPKGCILHRAGWFLWFGVCVCAYLCLCTAAWCMG